MTPCSISSKSLVIHFRNQSRKTQYGNNKNKLESKLLRFHASP